MHQDLSTGEVIQYEEPDAPKAGDLKFVQQKAKSIKPRHQTKENSL